MPRRRALPANPSDAPRLPENLFAMGIETIFFMGHRGCASRSTRSRIRGCSACSVTTSTLRPKRSATSARKPPRAKPDFRLADSTRRSTSLSGRASPRDMEPKRRTLRIPRRAAKRQISLRCRSMSGCMCSIQWRHNAGKRDRCTERALCESRAKRAEKAQCIDQYMSPCMSHGRVFSTPLFLRSGLENISAVNWFFGKRADQPPNPPCQGGLIPASPLIRGD